MDSKIVAELFGYTWRTHRNEDMQTLSFCFNGLDYRIPIELRGQSRDR